MIKSMKKNNKILAGILMVSLAFGISTNVSAAENNLEEALANSSDLSVELVDEIKFKELPNMDIADLSEESSLQHTQARMKEHTNLEEGNKLSNVLKGTRGVTQSWTGTLKSEGEFTYVLATLAPTQILNATLQCPVNESLNYDLFIYEVDENGVLKNEVAFSTLGTYLNTYPDGTVKTADEGAAFINNTSTTNNYAVIVMATEGGSSTDEFKLTIGLDVEGTYDSAEPNDSAYNSYAITEGTISGATLHVVNDQDWYLWKATSEFKSANITVSAGYSVEVYTANGNKMILTNQKSDGSFPIARGANYIRVFANENNFSPAVYSLSVLPWEVTPDKMVVALNGDEGATYPNYPEGSQYLRFHKKFSPQVGIKSKSGYRVPNHPVSLYWESGAWNEHTGNKTREVSGRTNSEGVVTLVLESPDLPVSLGSHSCYLNGAISFIHYYDVDGIIISSPGVEPYTDLVYHFARSSYVGS